ncbi:MULTISPECIES: amidohydrolase [unclassified Sphingomonas]|uniref:amidohydrolase n=1 Tax=unclassified Sphingomonas TaxID=196159 RepID=UPI0006FD5977|nr:MULTISPECIES: amidohydrolase [unclassified Sphingomonas]KQX20746.1 peptidase M20 [Sphingomonas sp. Root1294]KQY68592.1 peptidase M20 [Sphingomonas sp. Root50]KRB87998.1 peptidase M20 [Sphingomonas sp. Root720]
MKKLTSLLALAVAGLSMPANADPLEQAVKADLPSLTAIYRDLHTNPELSFKEGRSAGIMAAEAKKAGFEVTTGVGGTGVVAVLKNGPGPVLLLRADMDALPVTEQTGLPYASKTPGVMHACGHDTHMASWIGTARRMAAMKDSWSGTLVMIGQPAEEIGSGARAMLKDGLYTRFPKPSTVIAFHDSAALPAGTIGIVDGYAMANVDSVDVLVKGEGGHGAYPHLAKDPIVIAARIVTTLQTLISRETDPLESGVVTVGSFQGGTKHNIIPPDAKLQITVRSYTPEVRKHLLDGIARIAKGEAIAGGMSDDKLPVVTLQDQNTPATFNTHDITARMSALFTARFGKDRVVPARAQMGGEDFSEYYLADTSIQSLLLWVGGVRKDKWDAVKGDITQLPSIHSPFWAPDAEAVISTAVEAMTSASLAVLKK